MSLQQEFEQAVKLGWDKHFVEAAKLYMLPVEHLWAIASRETNLNPLYLKKKGDNGHGHGLMQIDDRSFAQWCMRKNDEGVFLWQVARECILMGAAVYREKRQDISRLLGKGSFNFKRRAHTINDNAVSAEDSIALPIASYNCGAGGALMGFKEGNIDKYTTGADYSEDVLRRAKIFKEMLDEIKT